MKKGGVHHAGAYEVQEKKKGVITSAAQVADLVDGSDEWKYREGTKGFNKMYQQRSSDVNPAESRSLDLGTSQLTGIQRLLSPPDLPHSPQSVPLWAVRNWINPDTTDQALVKVGSTSQACSLPLDSITNIMGTKRTADNPLPYMSPSGTYQATSQATPQPSGSDNSSLEKDQISAFWMSLGWGENGDLNFSNLGGAPKSAEAPQYPSTCTLTTPAALRSIVGVLHDGTDEILVTPSTLAGLEVRANIYFPSLLYVITETNPNQTNYSAPINQTARYFCLIQPLSLTRRTATSSSQTLGGPYRRSLKAPNFTANSYSVRWRVQKLVHDTSSLSFRNRGRISYIQLYTSIEGISTVQSDQLSTISYFNPVFNT